MRHPFLHMSITRPYLIIFAFFNDSILLLHFLNELICESISIRNFLSFICFSFIGSNTIVKLAL